MEINIKLMSEAAYITLQKNPDDVYKNLLSHPKDSSWLREYLGFEPYEEKEYRIRNFEFINNDVNEDTLLDNSIMLYEHLKQLPRYILCDPKFWAWITFEKTYAYAQKINKVSSAGFVSTAWLISGNRRSLMQGIISRLFFMVSVSVDEARVNQYELTGYLFTNPETYRNFCYQNMSMLKNVTLAVIQAQKDISEKAGIILLSKISSDMVKEASKIGSVMLLDVMTKEEIYTIIYPKFIQIILDYYEAQKQKKEE